MEPIGHLNPSFTHSDRARQNVLLAFTLIELLLAVAIIALLASLVLPALSKAKGRAQRIICVSNLQQFGLGLRLWADDPALAPHGID